jgi:hypothetical protein
MTPRSQIALRAASLYPSIGRQSARRMVERAGCPVSLYVLARQLMACEEFDMQLTSTSLDMTKEIK